MFQLFTVSTIDETWRQQWLPSGEEFESVVTEEEAAGVLATSLCLDGEDIENAASMFESSCCKFGGQGILAGGEKLHDEGGSFGLPQNPCQPNLVPKWRQKNYCEVIWFWANTSMTSSGNSLDWQNLENQLLSGVDGFGDFRRRNENYKRKKKEINAAWLRLLRNDNKAC